MPIECWRLNKADSSALRPLGQIDVRRCVPPSNTKNGHANASDAACRHRGARERKAAQSARSGVSGQGLARSVKAIQRCSLSPIQRCPLLSNSEMSPSASGVVGSVTLATPGSRGTRPAETETSAPQRPGVRASGACGGLAAWRVLGRIPDGISGTGRRQRRPPRPHPAGSRGPKDGPTPVPARSRLLLRLRPLQA